MGIEVCIYLFHHSALARFVCFGCLVSVQQRLSFYSYRVQCEFDGSKDNLAAYNGYHRRAAAITNLSFKHVC